MLDISLTRPFTIPGFPAPYYLTPMATVLGVGLTNAAGIISFTQSVPNVPWLAFRDLFLQGAVASFTTGTMGTTPPYAVHIR